jgi:hypothetical protein
MHCAALQCARGRGRVPWVECAAAVMAMPVSETAVSECGGQDMSRCIRADMRAPPSPFRRACCRQDAIVDGLPGCQAATDRLAECQPAEAASPALETAGRATARHAPAVRPVRTHANCSPPPTHQAGGSVDARMTSNDHGLAAASTTAGGSAHADRGGVDVQSAIDVALAQAMDQASDCD